MATEAFYTESGNSPPRDESQVESIQAAHDELQATFTELEVAWIEIGKLRQDTRRLLREKLERENREALLSGEKNIYDVLAERVDQQKADHAAHLEWIQAIHAKKQEFNARLVSLGLSEVK